MLQFSVLEQDRNIFHFMTTRHGGIGQGAYASFNLGEFVEDEPLVWQTNRQLLCDHLAIPVDRLFVPYQTHETHICEIDDSFLSLPVEEQKNKLYGVDALVTTVPGVCIAITTADCVPLLLYAPDKKVVASIHAGWRGTVEDIAGKTVDYLVKTFQCDPAQILTGIGAAISPGHFEIGEEVVAAFESIITDSPFVCFHNEVTGKYHLDLITINRRLLMKKGVLKKHIEQSVACTYSNSADFFSARRDGLRSGRMLTGILIKE